MSLQATGWMASLYVPTARLQQTQQMQQHTIQKSKSTQLISWILVFKKYQQQLWYYGMILLIQLSKVLFAMQGNKQFSSKG